eukprot:Gb_24612 [translate_table: standard]
MQSLATRSTVPFMFPIEELLYSVRYRGGWWESFVNHINSPLDAHHR